MVGVREQPLASFFPETFESVRHNVGSVPLVTPLWSGMAIVPDVARGSSVRRRDSPEMDFAVLARQFPVMHCALIGPSKL